MLTTSRAWTFSVEDREKLIKGAFEAKEGSYSPCSKFPVGAPLLTPDGRIIKGANVENASYSVTICTECMAIVKAANEVTYSFIGLLVTTNVLAATFLCGICRQVVREFYALNMLILLVPGDYPQAPTNDSKSGFGKRSERDDAR